MGSERSVYYHHPDNKHLSLQFLNPDRHQVENEARKSNADLKEIIKYDLETTVYVLYTGEKAPGMAEEIDVDPDELVAGMGPSDRQITATLLRAFVEIIEEKEEEESEKLRAYKNIEPSQIPDALSRVNWGGTVAEVGGRLMSNLILKHALPNANHRSSLVLLERYIRSHEFHFSLPTLHTEDYDWRDWADEYICESKRLLTIRRNAPRFYYLWEFGADEVIRKGDIRIDLDEYSLTRDINEAHSHYANLHEQLCQELAVEIINRQGHQDLEQKDGISKHEFAERLNNLP